MSKAQLSGPDHPHWKNAKNINSAGYVTVQHRRQTMGEHRVVAEKALGRPLPEGAEIHHIDENRLNNHPSNLVICESKKYHKLLHTRLRVVLRGGDPETQKICARCKKLLGQDCFNVCSRADDKLDPYCRPCKKSINHRGYLKRNGLLTDKDSPGNPRAGVAKVIVEKLGL